MLPKLFIKIRKTILNLLLGRDISSDFDIFYNAASYTDSLEGDYLEFGVYRGNSFINAYYSFQSARKDFNKSRNYLSLAKRDGNLSSRFFAFDSFKGLPEVSGIDIGGAFSTGQFNCTKSEFINNLTSYSIRMEKIYIIEGFYKETLNAKLYDEYSLEKARVIHIDCDLYESTKTVLNFITPIIQNGSIIIFDDWFQFYGHPEKGEQKAFKEWLSSNNLYASEFMKKLPLANSFIVGIKD